MSQPNQPDPKFMAQQLRKPSGEAAPKVSQKMDAFNEPLFDLTLATMDISEGDSILEIGFGSGQFLSRLFTRATQLKVEGIDYSPEMVEMARSNNFHLINSGALKVDFGDSKRLPFAENSFDKVFCNMVVYFWDQPGAHLKEVHRVLKPGGKLFTGIRTKDSMHQLPFVEHGFNLFSETGWKEQLQQNGFTFSHSKSAIDPPMEGDDGRTIQMESVCIVGIKEK